MTIGELSEILRRQPEMIDLLVAYIEAKERCPEKVTQAMPIILKILQDGKQKGVVYGNH